MRTEIPERARGTFVPAERIKKPDGAAALHGVNLLPGSFTDALVNGRGRRCMGAGAAAVGRGGEIPRTDKVCRRAAALWRTADEGRSARTAAHGEGAWRGVRGAGGIWDIFALVRGLDMELRGDFGLNGSTRGAAVFEGAGAIGRDAVVRAAARAAAGPSARASCEAIVYGRLPLMITENCIVANEFGCRHFGALRRRLRAARAGAPELTDRVGERFPVLHAYGCRSEPRTARRCGWRTSRSTGKSV